MFTLTFKQFNVFLINKIIILFFKPYLTQTWHGITVSTNIYVSIKDCCQRE